MIYGKMTVGFAGNENVEILSISREEYLSLMEQIRGGAKLVFLGDSVWANPTQITYIKFKRS